MADYIEREAFLEQKREQYCKDCARRKGMKNGKYKTLYEIGEAPCRACGIDDMLNDVEDFPAADVREVVLCKDCVHYEMGVCLKIYDDGNVSKDAWQERKPTDFCSYGEDRNAPTNRETKICSTDYTKTVTADEEREVLNVRAWLNNGADMREEQT